MVLKKFTKREWIIFGITDIILALICMLGRQISFVGVWGNPQENYVKCFDLISILNFVIALFFNGIILTVVCNINSNYHKDGKDFLKRICNKNKCFEKIDKFLDNRMNCLFFLIIIMVCWLPYILTYLPGGVFADTFGSISMAFNMDELGFRALDNHHPVLYTLLWRGSIVLVRAFGGDLYATIVFFQIVQYVVMASILAYYVKCLRKYGLNKWGVIGGLLFVSLFPLFPLYAISLWKDVPFALSLLLFEICIAECIIERDKNCLQKNDYIIRFCILGLLVAFTRNNGKYIIYITILTFTLFNFRNVFHYKKMIIGMLTLVMSITIIQGPVYNKLNYNVDKTVESMGIPLQQMCYLSYYDYDMTESEKEYINSIVDISEIKSNYVPCLVDSIKWYTNSFDVSVIEKDYAKFFKCYFQLMLKHPIAGIKSYMLATAGFWASNVTSGDGYVQNFIWNNPYGIEGHDLLEEHFGFNMKKLVNNMKPISSAVFFLFMIYIIFVLIINRDYDKVGILLPAIANWATVMIATLIACSLRYVYILVLIVPMEILLLCISEAKVHK